MRSRELDCWSRCGLVTRRDTRVHVRGGRLVELEVHNQEDAAGDVSISDSAVCVCNSAMPL